MTNPFTRHPAQIGLGYFGHMKLALGYAVLLFVATVVVVIHAFLPWVFECVASDIVTDIAEEMEAHKYTEEF